MLKTRRLGQLDGIDPWFGTFSIIAFDPVTNELGVGVQSRAFGAGAAVPYAKPGVGAVATQASANRQYGPKAIALLEQGIVAAEVVKRITDEDPGRDTRQVGGDRHEGPFRGLYRPPRDRAQLRSQDLVHLGGYAGHVSGPNFSAQGNTLASEEVVKAMAAAYQNGKGSMAERLMDALDAGQAKGGDTRGMQSAGILVVRPLPPNSESTVERIVDIRVDDHEDPFKELRRLARHDDRRAESTADAIGGAVERRQARRGDRRSEEGARRSTRAASRRCISWRAAMPPPAIANRRSRSCHGDRPPAQAMEVRSGVRSGIRSVAGHGRISALKP